MHKAIILAAAMTAVVAPAAFGTLGYDSTSNVIANQFVTSYTSIYFDDATLSTPGQSTIDQLNLGFEDYAFSGSVNFDLLIQFYNNVNYSAGYGVPVGTGTIGNMIDITGLSATAFIPGSTGLVNLSGLLPTTTTGTVGYEFEFVNPGATQISEANLAPGIEPVFSIGSPSLGNSSPYFAFDSLNKSTIVGDAASGDIWMFPAVDSPSNVAAQFGVGPGPQISVPGGQSYTINAGSSSTINVNRIAGLAINSGSTVTIAPSTTQASRQLVVISSTGLQLAGSTGNWTGLLNLNNNDLDLPGASLSTVTDQIRQGYAGGTWNGSGGITSSAAAANHLTALGVIQNNQNGSAVYSTFDGQPVGASDVLVKYTYFGDANLDGQVDGSDYTLIDNGFNNELTGWLNGDFNYDGIIDGSDYTLIDNSFDTQSTTLSPEAQFASSTAQLASSTSVPEPVSSAMVVTAAGFILSRRRR